jgi:hypothetical protein
MSSRTLDPGDTVELNSGSPPLTVIEVTTPGRNPDGEDVVVWWRSNDGEPRILELDTRCFRLLARGGGRPA